MEQHYKILGLEEGATLKEVEDKYNELLKEFDPEKQEEALQELFKSEQEKLKEAYKEISLSFIKKEEAIEKEIEELEEEIENNDIDEIKPWNIFEEEGEAEEETNALNQPNSFLEGESNAKEGLDQMVYWAKFFSVIGYVVVVFFAIKSFGFLLDDEPGELFLYFLPTLICYLTARGLFRFAKKTRWALSHNNQKDLAEGLQDLGSSFKFFGIIIIISGFWLFTYFDLLSYLVDIIDEILFFIT